MNSPFSSSSPLSTPSSGRPPRPAASPASVLGLWPVLPAAIVIGVIYHFIGQFLDLLILFPIVAGVCVGAVLSTLAKKHKVRSKVVLCALAIIGGLLCFTSRWAGDALQAREAFINSYSSQMGKGNPVIEAKAQAVLRRSYPPLQFFPLYVQAAAEQGTTISSTHDYSSSSNRPITGTGFWLITLADLLLMCAGAVGVAWKQATTPFCVGCDSWHGVELTVSRLHPDQSDEAARLAQNGEWAGLGGLRSSGATEKSHCDVLLSKCPACATGNLSVKRRLNNKVKILWKGSVASADTQKLEEVRAQWLQ